MLLLNPEEPEIKTMDNWDGISVEMECVCVCVGEYENSLMGIGLTVWGWDGMAF